MSSFDFLDLLLHGHLGFHGPRANRQQGIRVGRAHGQAPRLGPRASALQCGELAERSRAGLPTSAGRSALSLLLLTAGTAVVDAAATAAVDAAKIGPPGGDRRGVAFPTPAALAPVSVAGA